MLIIDGKKNCDIGNIASIGEGRWEGGQLRRGWKITIIFIIITVVVVGLAVVAVVVVVIAIS
jgi:hypothetical protein